MLSTDYLVIGSGAASMAFCDTLLTDLPDAKIIIVDKHSAPGGHWNDAYDFVQLHAPSLSYGVPSRQLEGNWFKSIFFQWKSPLTHRASKQEILKYFRDLMDDWIASGRVQYYPECVYNFDQQPQPNEDFSSSSSHHQRHTFTSLDGTKTYQVDVAVKLVNGIVGECRVPSQTPPSFPIDPLVPLLTPNDLYESQPIQGCKYVILGCGKTAMDAIVYLQRQLQVSPGHILWIIPNDVWMMRRVSALPWTWNQTLIDHELDFQAATRDFEHRGILTRLDPSIEPTIFRYPTVGDDELEDLRRIPETNRIRRGRVSAISVIPVVDYNAGNDDWATKENGMYRVEFENDLADILWLTKHDHMFVDCTSSDPINHKNENKQNFSPFHSEKEIRLHVLFSLQVPWSSSCIAALESRRRRGLLDFEFGRQVIKSAYSHHASCEPTENDILQAVMPGYGFTTMDNSNNMALSAARPILNLAGFLALYDRDARKGYQWTCHNRLSLFYAFGFRCQVYEILIRILDDNDRLYGFSGETVRSISMLAEKLKPLQGK